MFTVLGHQGFGIISYVATDNYHGISLWQTIQEVAKIHWTPLFVLVTFSFCELEQDGWFVLDTIIELTLRGMFYVSFLSFIIVKLADG